MKDINDLVGFVLDHVKDKATKIEVELDDWKVTGLRKKHQMDFTLRIVVTIDGERYCISEERQSCWENGTLNILMPDPTLRLTTER